MGGGMPYHLEKGVTLRVIERHLNGDRQKMSQTLRGLRDEVDQWPSQWVDRVLPNLWPDPGLRVRVTSANHVRSDWFGLVEQSDHTWAKPVAPPGHEPPPTTGYWIGYRGEVEPIVKKAFTWALEVALGLGPGDPPDPNPGLGPPDQIELLWTCPVPWFEAWVVRRPIDDLSVVPAAGGGRRRGLVTVHFLTPSHTGANVAESPVATAPHALEHPVTGAPLPHPVPSLEIDYQELGVAWAHGAVMAGHRPRGLAQQRNYATWVVTHREHVNQVVAPGAATYTTTRASGLGQWDLPPLNVYEATGPVVVVSPSLRAGGVTHDGVVDKDEAEALGMLHPPGSTTPAGSATAAADAADEEAGR